MPDPTEKVFREIDRSKRELISFLKEFVQIRTINPPGENYKECAIFLEKKLKELNLKARKVDVPKKRLVDARVDFPRTSVIGLLKGKLGKQTLHINGHFDVVPVGSGWTVDPFGGEIHDGKMYGRGTSDMKGGVAAAIMAAASIARSDLELSGNLEISSTPDEETGGELGAGYLVSNGHIHGDAAIVAEGSEVDQVSIAHKGVLWMELKTIGKATHASRPHLGVNAVTKMARVLLALDKLAEDLKGRKTASSSIFHDAPWPVLTVGGKITGGTKINIVPDSCTSTLDRRLLPEEKVEDAEKEILAVIEELKRQDSELKIEMKPLLKIAPLICDKKSLIVSCLTEAIERINGASPQIVGTSGFTDAHYFGQKMPTAMFGPATHGIGHQADEYVEIDHLMRATKVFAATAIRMLS